MVSAVRDPQSSARTQITCNQFNLLWSENGFTKYLTCDQGHTGKIIFQAKEDRGGSRKGRTSHAEA